MNLLLVEPDELSPEGLVTLEDVRARHLLGVLRVVPEQAVRVGVVNGALGTGRVVSVSGHAVTLACTVTDVPPVPRVDLLLAVPRPKVLKRLWAQLAALGVRRILLTNAARVERNYFDTHLLDPEGFRPFLLEGLQQARDTRLPDVTVHRQFKVLVEDELDQLAGPARKLVADPSATTRVADAIGAAAGDARVLLAVGPEGGWNAFELGLLTAHGFTAVDMGARTLRSDTACIALLALVHEALRGA